MAVFQISSMLTVLYGFRETPDVPNPQNATYSLGRETLLASARQGIAHWRERFFAFMARNAARPAAFCRLPPQDVIEVRIQVEI